MDQSSKTDLLKRNSQHELFHRTRWCQSCHRRQKTESPELGSFREAREPKRRSNATSKQEQQRQKRTHDHNASRTKNHSTTTSPRKQNTREDKGSRKILENTTGYLPKRINKSYTRTLADPNSATYRHESDYLLARENLKIEPTASPWNQNHTSNRIR